MGAPQGTESVSPEARTSIAEVVAYIGLIMKEQSEVPQACSLYRRAAVLAPFHASLCLNLMHCYSVRQLEVQAIAWGVRFSTSSSQCQPPPLSLQACATRVESQWTCSGRRLLRQHFVEKTWMASLSSTMLWR